MQAHNELTNISAGYSEKQDVFVFVFSDETEENAPVNLEDKLLYPIGSNAWIWEEAETIQL